MRLVSVLGQRQGAERKQSAGSPHDGTVSGFILLQSPVPEEEPNTQLHQEHQCHGHLWDTVSGNSHTEITGSNCAGNRCSHLLSVPLSLPKEPSIMNPTHDQIFTVKTGTWTNPPSAVQSSLSLHVSPVFTAALQLRGLEDVLNAPMCRFKDLHKLHEHLTVPAVTWRCRSNVPWALPWGPLFGSYCWH